MLALVIIPNALASVRAAKPNHITTLVAGSPEPLYRKIALQTLLPLGDENLPFSRVVGADKFYDWS